MTAWKASFGDADTRLPYPPYLPSARHPTHGRNSRCRVRHFENQVRALGIEVTISIEGCVVNGLREHFQQYGNTLVLGRQTDEKHLDGGRQGLRGIGSAVGSDMPQDRRFGYGGDVALPRCLARDVRIGPADEA